MKTLLRFVIVMLSIPMFAQARGLKVYSLRKDILEVARFLSFATNYEPGLEP